MGVTIFQHVTLGAWRGASPVVHSRSALFPGAKIFGGISVGWRSTIGANAVVVKDVARNDTVMGVPAVSRNLPSASTVISEQA